MSLSTLSLFTPSLDLAKSPSYLVATFSYIVRIELTTHKEMIFQTNLTNTTEMIIVYDAISSSLNH